MNPFSALAARFRAFFEAGRRWTADRSYIPGEITDSRFDATKETRQEIVRKALYFEANNSLCNRLLDLVEQYTVGPTGLTMVPASSDSDWNQAAAEYWQESSSVLDLVSRQPVSTLQTLSARTWANQGESFILKTSGGTAPFRPRIQLIEGHRVATPASMSEKEGKSIIDGVEIDSRGRPIAYWISEGISDDAYRRVDAFNIVHIYEPSRVGQYRGLPWWYPVLNDLHDLDDLQILEMRAAKDAAEKSTIVKNGAGATSAEKLLKARFSGTSTNIDGTTTTKEQTAAYKAVFGGRTMFLKPGEDVTQFVSNRPSVAVQWYWELLISKICIGFGIPKMLAYPVSIQGTVARADLDIANAFFQSRHEVLAAAWQEIYRYVIGAAREFDPRLAKAPKDWWKVTTRPPRAVNVDVGYNSTASLNELKECVTTLEDIYTPRGLDWTTRVRQRAREIAFMKQVANEEGVSAAELSESMSDPDPVQHQEGAV